MRHRRLNRHASSLAAIDDAIDRGKRRDWTELRRAALGDRALIENTPRFCGAHIENPYAQRYHCWMSCA